MKKKILCIVGPTATGKTALAIQIAKLYPSVLISADSRQVYKGMDIVTGKDHPDDIQLAGINIVAPDEECSVSTWYDAISPSLSLGKLPIMVGGTGLYIRAVTDGIATMAIPPDKVLRERLNSLSLLELQQELAQKDKAKLESMNNSDSNNPRRLIRAIEVSSNGNTRILDNLFAKPVSLLIGLTWSDESAYKEMIRLRVAKRLEEGAIEETKRLLSTYSPSLPSMSAIGYRSIISYLRGNLDHNELISRWTSDELAYAKRQMTWFRQVKNIKWFEANDNKLIPRVAECVSSWYDG